MDKRYLGKVIDETIPAVTLRLTGLELRRKECCHSCPGDNDAAISISITGLPQSVTLLYRAKHDTFRAIAKCMKRGGQLDESEVSIYVNEYFNILCGRVISRINRETGSSMRFGVPSYHRNAGRMQGKEFINLCYECVSAGDTMCLSGAVQ